MQNILAIKSTNTGQMRLRVSEQLIAISPNINNYRIKTISARDLNLLFELYDSMFLDDWFKRNFKGIMKFSFSRRMTKSAGATLCPRNIDKILPNEIIIEIRLGVDFFMQYDHLDGEKQVCGVVTHNSLEAMQLVFEHEICHAIEYVCFKASSCRKDRFKALANNLFGHTQSYHQLPTNQQIVSQKLGLNVGDYIMFDFEGKSLEGILNRINKRGTVMVRDINGTHVDKLGNRYAKYYVPLSCMQKKINGNNKKSSKC